MRPSFLLTNTIVGLSAASDTVQNVTKMLERPVMTRFWQTGTYTLGSRVNVSQAAKALAGMKPSYVSGIYRFAYQDTVTAQMQQDYNTIRTAVLAASPQAKFDMELNLDPNPTSGHNTTYPDAEAVVDMMEYLNSQLQFESFFFDFLSIAETDNATWVKAVVTYAHSVNQTVGGNVFNTTIPPNVDFVSFVDGRSSANPDFGYGINESSLKELKANNKQNVAIVGHMNNNPQEHPSTTLSCVFIDTWNATRRADYQDYWISQQTRQGGFTYMFPVFFPQCPGLVAYDPLKDTVPDTNGETVYDRIQQLALTDDE